ncbi:16022_t:CDS:10 [Acaulospora colombiana]|uniref:16022_t:CDS:1 n=1 Tax=Acaulospora colombiana TaxID=27376 RepID=A0ACA9L222_9GLOM|nr:16022_t:CDS:10 [Acaulospora colombiana]
MAQFADLVDRLEQIIGGKTSSREEEELVALILTGSGNTFCSGFDLSVAKQHILTSENGARMSSLMQDTLFRFGQLPLISVAAIEGHALGGGAELSTACDHRYTAKVRFVQVKMATTPGWGGGGRLIRIVGGVNALRIMGATVLLTGQHALDIGFADALAENGESALNKSKEFLDPYVYFYAHREGESVSERRRNSVRAVRGIKSIIARANNDEAQKEFLRWEHRLFTNYWGQHENVAAMSVKQQQINLKVYDNVLSGFLLVRPVWVDDETVKTCKSCGTSFTPLRRKAHGARGLLDIVERKNEQELSNFITYGGLDALVYLCRTSQSYDLHFWGTTALANISGYDSLKPYIIMKGGLQHLYNLILFYFEKLESQDLSITTRILDHISSIVQNIGNILYCLSTTDSLCRRMLPDDTSLDAILKLSSFRIGNIVDDEEEDETLTSYEEIRLRVELAQALASKSISNLAGNHSHQLLIIESPTGSLDRLMSLLQSNVYEVRKYAAKSIAYLSLRNDKYKSILIKNGRAEILASVVDVEDEESAKADQVTISHACCAMANLATNVESQQFLIRQSNLLSNLCRMVKYFIKDREVQRHIARLLANFALYDENKMRMLAYQIISIDDDTSQSEESWGSVISTLIAIGDSPVSDVEIQRHIIRALDNLSTDVPPRSRSKLSPCIPLINRILEMVKDEDIRKRATHVLNKLTPSSPPVSDVDDLFEKQKSCNGTDSQESESDLPVQNLIIFDDCDVPRSELTDDDSTLVS